MEHNYFAAGKITESLESEAICGAGSIVTLSRFNTYAHLHKTMLQYDLNHIFIYKNTTYNKDWFAINNYIALNFNKFSYFARATQNKTTLNLI